MAPGAVVVVITSGDDMVVFQKREVKTCNIKSSSYSAICKSVFLESKILPGTFCIEIIITCIYNSCDRKTSKKK